MTRRIEGKLGSLRTLLPLILLLSMLGAIGLHAVNRPVSYDGAMNLQVAQALADGRGYVRSYGGIRPFPAEVQTNAPFVVPAALVFKLFGVGIPQAQVVNLAYMLAFLALVAWVAARFCGWGAGFISALVVTTVPGFHWIGLNGWGELVALFWWAAGTAMLLWRDDPYAHAAVRAAGAACLGLALATKTVILIGIGATALIYAVWLVWARPRAPLAVLSRLAWATLFLLLPLGLMEVWRMQALGGFLMYHDWWADQFNAITWQTGLLDQPAAVSSPKLVRHFAVLALQIGLPQWLLAGWLLLPLMISCIALWHDSPWASTRSRLWSAVLVVVVIYLVWWLMLTPDTHVRLRRIEIGLILVQILWLFCIGRFAGMMTASWVRRSVFFSITMVFVVVTTLFANDALFDLRRNWPPKLDAFRAGVRQVRDLPQDAALFGKGFLSAPVVPLYAGRDLDDIDLYTAAELKALDAGYAFVDGPAMRARRFAEELVRYPHQLVVEAPGLKVYRLDFKQRKNPFRAKDMRNGDTAPWVDFTRRRYRYAFGLLAPSRAGWRWARTDAEVLLRSNGGSSLAVRVYRPDGEYARGESMTVAAYVNECPLGVRPLPRATSELVFVVPRECGIAAGSNIRVRLEADNMLERNLSDLRQHSYVVRAIGFR